MLTKKYVRIILGASCVFILLSLLTSFVRGTEDQKKEGFEGEVSAVTTTPVDTTNVTTTPVDTTNITDSDKAVFRRVIGKINEQYLLPAGAQAAVTGTTPPTDTGTTPTPVTGTTPTPVTDTPAL